MLTPFRYEVKANKTIHTFRQKTKIRLKKNKKRKEINKLNTNQSAIFI